MQIQIFGVIVLVLGLLSLNLNYQWAIYFLVLCCLFACSSAIAFPAIGGLTILPANLFLLFFALRAFNIGGGAALWRPVAPGSPGFPLLCLCVFAVVGGLFLPRAMAGATYVYAINRGAIDPNAPDLQPLGPVSGNLTQSIYFIGEVLVYCCMAVFLSKKDSYKHFANAILLVAALNVIAAIIDIGSSSVGINVLGVIKTASYTLHEGEEVGGLRRIAGTFAEASAFSGFTLLLFAFSANLWLFGYRPRITGMLTFASGVLLALSTSATAYVGFAVYLVVLLLGRCGRIAPRSESRKLRLCAVVICVGIMALLYAIVFRPSLLESLGGFFNDAVLNKVDSASGIERGAWNRQALVNLVETFGFGVGIGSSRTSSFILVLLSNLGIVGTMLFGVFICKCTVSPIPTHGPMLDRVVCYASRQTMLAILVSASISGTVFDLGPCFYMFAAAAGMLSSSVRRVAPVGGVDRPGNRSSPEKAQPSRSGVFVGHTRAPATPLLDSHKHESRIPAWPHRG